ncbi:hypothetical protein EO98_15775 [Methanosarcina sp. 2.H.T.1A.6]|uniref:hypothetical protein n=1 Tax=unclassified Methanosarcina TaxID=2644672 RepID=UPI0006221C30|nr:MULTISPECIES: hypothetical protein [unclassified Methanosarcina]KKG11729.1 hypothetical protein EO97_11275 [Methanosarcina sp. 2.H.T.1A.15]KKG17623.1 hypothetical protein EO94_12200 [Methanosarcina sp. 2.H.T.1A.3]KKG21863.1 hypothetical protein EO98_15775 [Methanosarcina sp. 2.H.T.1A.6]KKG25399.1 hypothetical protein EO96_00225 [Methanosarcina sp. 2.H.T.1A.8]
MGHPENSFFLIVILSGYKIKLTDAGFFPNFPDRVILEYLLSILDALFILMPVIRENLSRIRIYSGPLRAFNQCLKVLAWQCPAIFVFALQENILSLA